MISGSPSIFPEFAGTGGTSGKRSLFGWLDAQQDGEHARYLVRMLRLFAQLVTVGNTPLLVKWVPYNVMIATITNERMSRGGKDPNPYILDLCSAMVQLARVLYVTNKPNAKLAHVKLVRTWDNIESAAHSRMLSTRLTTIQDDEIEWDGFDQLKRFIRSFVLGFGKAQRGIDINQNDVVLQCLHLLHDLILHGFYRFDEICTGTIPLLFKVLDGGRRWIRIAFASRYVCKT